MTLQPQEDESLALLGDMLSRLVDEHAADAAALWRALTRDLGVAEAVIGGDGEAGGGAEQLWVIMEALGRAPCWTPFLSSVLLGGGVLRRGGGAKASRLLSEAAAGTMTLAVAYLEPGRRNAVAPELCRVTEIGDELRLTGEKTVVLGGADAEWLIVSACEADGSASLFLIDATQATRRPLETLDGSRAADVSFDGIVIGPDDVVGSRGQGLAVLEHTLDEALVAAYAAASGTLRTMLDQTVAYVQQRRQFGRALSEFQVVQHRLVDMYVELEQAISLAQVALAKLDGDASERREAVSGAKVLIAGACRAVSQGAVQLHGGIGTTEELPLARYFRRALMFEHLFGSADFHLRRYMDAAA